MALGWSRGSFARKITAVVLLASATSLATLTAAFLVLDSLSARAQLQSQLSTLADIVGQNSTAALHFSDSTAAVEVLQALRAEAPITSACLYQLSGMLFADYQRDPGPRACPEHLDLVGTTTQDYSRVVRPLDLRSDLRQLEDRRRRLLLLATGLLFAALAIGGFAGSLLQQRISRPISRLALAMQRVTDEQNFAERVEVTGNDEIARLGLGFNTMLAEIEHREAVKKKVETLQQQAFCDALTGLPNRRLLIDRLGQTLAAADRSANPVALLYLDLDGFKLVNDSLGHHFGDRLLVEVAARLRSRVRQSDTLARLGGDEFTIVLAHLRHASEAAAVADALLDDLAAPFVIDDREITIGASIGISLYPDGATDSAELMHQADSAMYAAKRAGKNRRLYYTHELGSAVRETARPGNPAPRRHRTRRDSSPLPAGIRAAIRPPGAIRGARPLDASHARDDPSQPLHSYRRGERHHRCPGRRHHGAGLCAGRAVARPCTPSHPGGGQCFQRPVQP
jgi:diguanylate cyclase (GGDEF)-like protein